MKSQNKEEERQEMLHLEILSNAGKDIIHDYELLSPEEFLAIWDNDEPDLENKLAGEDLI